LFGCYENFPKLIHCEIRFRTKYSRRTVQKLLLQALHKLNKTEFFFEEVAELARLHKATCKINFDFGIADSLSFTYLNEQELAKAQKIIRKNPLSIMDFFCVIRYYKITEKEKPRPLRFDYYLLRFVFDEKNVRVLAYHERGTRRISPKELLEFLLARINDVIVRGKRRN